MTDDELRKIIRIEILNTFRTLTAYAGRMKPDDTLEDVLRKLKWKLTEQIESSN